MRVAALFDIHGNRPALEAVLAELEGVDADLVVVGGDALLGPMPVETLERLRRLGPRLRYLRGNTEREILEPPHGDELWERRARWTRDTLPPEALAYLAPLLPTISLDVDGLGPVLFCHGSPRRDDEILTAISPEERVAPIVAGVAEGVIVHGHTHVRYDRLVAGRRLVCAGSVGMPYEGRAAAFWAVLGPEVELCETPYDVVAAATAIRETGFPDANEFVASVLEAPATAAEATEHFESLASGG